MKKIIFARIALLAVLCAALLCTAVAAADPPSPPADVSLSFYSYNDIYPIGLNVSFMNSSDAAALSDDEGELWCDYRFRLSGGDWHIMESIDLIPYGEQRHTTYSLIFFRAGVDDYSREYPTVYPPLAEILTPFDDGDGVQGICFDTGERQIEVAARYRLVTDGETLIGEWSQSASISGGIIHEETTAPDAEKETSAVTTAAVTTSPAIDTTAPGTSTTAAPSSPSDGAPLSGMPFETLPEPVDFSLSYRSEEDTEVLICAMLPRSLYLLTSATATEASEKYGCSDVSLAMEFDWSVNREDGWNYTAAWDGTAADGTREGSPISFTADGKKIISDGVLFSLGDEPTAALFAAFTYLDVATDRVMLDFSVNAVYLRARYVLTYSDSSATRHTLVSEWSTRHRVGRDTVTLPDASELAAPVVTVKTQGERPVLTAENPDTIFAAAFALRATYGYSFTAEAQIRATGSSSDDDWRDCTVGAEAPIFGDFYISYAGEPIPSGNGYELRMRYVCRTGDTELLATPWSAAAALTSLPDSTPVETSAPDDVTTAPGDSVKTKNVCPVCHLCSAPGGVCMFIWVMIVLGVIFVALVVLLIIVKRRGDRYK